MTDPTIPEVVEGEPPAKSVADLLRDAYSDAGSSREPKAIQLFGYGEPDMELWVTFRMVDDYDKIQEHLAPIMKRGGPKQQKIVNLGLETLVMAAEGSYAVINGARHDIGARLGVELYDQLGLNPGSPHPGSDRAAAFLLFKENKFRVADAFMTYNRWVKRGGVDAEDEALGE